MGGTSGGGESRTVTTQELAPEQRQLLEFVIPQAEQFAQNPPQQFPGSTIAPPTELQQQGRRRAVQSIPGAERTAQSGQQTQQSLGAGAGVGTAGVSQLVGNLGRASPALDFMLSGQVLDPSTNPALQRTIESAVQPLRREFETQVIPNIGRQAVQAGQLGGTRQGIAEGLAAEQYQRSVGDVSSQIATQGYLQGLQALQGTLGDVISGGVGGAGAGIEGGARSLFALPQTIQSSLFPAQIMEAVGSQQQFEQQQQLSEEAQRFFAEQILPFAAAQDVANLAFGIGGGTGTATTTGQQGSIGPSPFSAALGGGSLGAMVGTGTSLGGPAGAGIGAAAGLLLGLV